jgi:predicted transcriptional regulator
MSDDSAKVQRELTAEIVVAYTRRNQLSTDQLPNLISTVHQTLHRLGTSQEEPKERVPAVSVKKSVGRHFVVCIECGWKGKMLRRHLGSHGLTRDEYRARWRLSSDHPLTAPSYSEARSGLAKQLGLGRKRGGRPASKPSSKATKSRTTQKAKRASSKSASRRRKRAA